MKRAYVKPVFLAEEFVAAASYVAGCGTRGWNPSKIVNGKTVICYDGHRIGGQQGNKGLINDGEYSTGVSYWDYASWSNDSRPGAGNADYVAEDAYLFNTGSTVCDFVWENTSDAVGVWKKTNETDENGILKWVVEAVSDYQSFAWFFFGNKATESKHTPAYNGTPIPS